MKISSGMLKIIYLDHRLLLQNYCNLIMALHHKKIAEFDQLKALPKYVSDNDNISDDTLFKNILLMSSMINEDDIKLIEPIYFENLQLGYAKLLSLGAMDDPTEFLVSHRACIEQIVSQLMIFIAKTKAANSKVTSGPSNTTTTTTITSTQNLTLFKRQFKPISAIKPDDDEFDRQKTPSPEEVQPISTTHDANNIPKSPKASHIFYKHEFNFTNKDNANISMPNNTAPAIIPDKSPSPPPIIPEGFKLKYIEKDGDCLFTAISDQLPYVHYTPLHDADSLRDATVKHMQLNATTYEECMDENFEKYLERMKMRGTWAGEHEISAISNSLKICIRVYTKDKFTRVYGEHFEKKVHVVYDGQGHYHSIYPLGITEKMRSSPSSVEYVRDLKIWQPSPLPDPLLSPESFFGSNKSNLKKKK
jgi:hypothetical protein